VRPKGECVTSHARHMQTDMCYSTRNKSGRDVTGLECVPISSAYHHAVGCSKIQFPMPRCFVNYSVGYRMFKTLSHRFQRGCPFSICSIIPIQNVQEVSSISQYTLPITGCSRSYSTMARRLTNFCIISILYRIFRKYIPIHFTNYRMFKKLLHHRETPYQLVKSFFSNFCIISILYSIFKKSIPMHFTNYRMFKKLLHHRETSLPTSKILLLKLLYNTYTIQHFQKVYPNTLYNYRMFKNVLLYPETSCQLAICVLSNYCIIPLRDV
jgi:hypothetical protein